MASATTFNLSRNDSAVLSALFDPEASLQRHAGIDQSVRNPYNTGVMSEIEQKEKSALLLINQENPSLTSIANAITELNQIIEQYPKYASAWNNRAQARRMAFSLEDFQNHEEELKQVLDDLFEAIRLASPSTRIESVSPANARVLASAHTHLGHLLLWMSRPNFPLQNVENLATLSGLSHDQLEEMASRHFAMGGQYGNKTAQQLAVKTNPYAKLCGSIVKEALQKEIKDFYSRPSPSSS